MTTGYARMIGAFAFVLAIIILFLLYGCATDQGPAQVQTVEVKIPVPVPCLAPADVPTAPTMAQPKAGSSIDQNAALVGIELLQRREWDAKAAALLLSCSTLVPSSAKVNP